MRSNNKQREHMNLLENTISNDAFIQVNKKLINVVGLEASVMLGDLVSKRKYFRDRGELHYGAFFITRDKITENLGLSAHQQRKAEKQLIKAGMLEIKSKSQMVNGKPICKKVNYYTIIDEVILLALKQNIDSRTSKSLTCVDENIEGADIKILNGTKTQVNKTPSKENQVKENRGNKEMMGDGGNVRTPNIPIIHKGETKTYNDWLSKDYNEWSNNQTIDDTLDFWNQKLQQLEQMKIECYG